MVVAEVLTGIALVQLNLSNSKSLSKYKYSQGSRHNSRSNRQSIVGAKSKSRSNVQKNLGLVLGISLG